MGPSQKTVEICSGTTNFFDKLNDLLANNHRNLLFDTVRDRKAEVLKSLLKSLNLMVRSAFNIWSSVAANEQVQEGYMHRIKEHVIETFERKTGGNKNNLLADALRHFARNARMQKFIASIYQKLLGSSYCKN